MNPTKEIPTITNPVTHYINSAYPDYMDEFNKGKTLLADEAGVSWATVHRATMGLFSAIPVKLVNFMAAHPVGDADHSASRWDELYWDYIADVLAELRTNIDNGHIEAVALFITPSNLKDAYPSFVEWRKSFTDSQMQFCRTFLIHQAILTKYEARQMKSLPQSIKDRLHFLDMSDEYIAAVGALPVKVTK